MLERCTCEARHCIERRLTAGQLRATPLASAKAAVLGCGAGYEEATVLPAREPRWAYRAAIDLRRRDADEELSVVRRIARIDGVVPLRIRRCDHSRLGRAGSQLYGRARAKQAENGRGVQ